MDDMKQTIIAAASVAMGATLAASSKPKRSCADPGARVLWSVVIMLVFISIMYYLFNS